MPHNPCQEYTLHPQRRAKNHTIAANELLDEQTKTACVAKVGFLKATTVGPALLPRGDSDVQEELCYS